MDANLPLANPEAEKCAQDIAEVFLDKVKRQEIFGAFVASHPDLKKWEGIAIASRAATIFKNII